MSSAMPPIDPKQCPYCAASPSTPCANHRQQAADPWREAAEWAAVTQIARAGREADSTPVDEIIEAAFALRRAEHDALKAENYRLRERIAVLGRGRDEARGALAEAEAERDRLREHLKTLAGKVRSKREIDIRSGYDWYAGWNSGIEAAARLVEQEPAAPASTLSREG